MVRSQRLDQPVEVRRSLRPAYDPEIFGQISERFARFMGTARFLVYMTTVVAFWVLWNSLAPHNLRFDEFPFIFLTLSLSLQASYAAPLILLAQTRQADRDKVHAMADAEHREDLYKASQERQALTEKQTELLVSMLQQNTELTQTVKTLTERLEKLTVEVHKKVLN